ncbi:MAG: SPOR domain-containing protein [Candidatus Omnitrophica bacterium]|nr:SPOR domain-containing protein [Candidatus Omnitrophota bacterium]
MMKSFLYKINLGILLLAVFCLYGFSDISLKNIETAIIKQDYKLAKEIASQLLSSELKADERDDILYYSGLCDLRLGQYAQARETFTKLTKKKIDGTLADKAYLGLFDGYYGDGHYKQAQRVAKRLLKVSPESEFLSLIYLKLARVNLKLTQWNQAREYLTKITVQFPDSLDAHVAKQLLNEKQYFAVQVGAFIDRKRAESLSVELQQKGEYAYIVETVDPKGRTFYRVRVGQLALLDEARKLKLKLSKEGYPTEIYP